MIRRIASRRIKRRQPWRFFARNGSSADDSIFDGLILILALCRSVLVSGPCYTEFHWFVLSPNWHFRFLSTPEDSLRTPSLRIFVARLLRIITGDDSEFLKLQSSCTQRHYRRAGHLLSTPLVSLSPNNSVSRFALPTFRPDPQCLASFQGAKAPLILYSDPYLTRNRAVHDQDAARQVPNAWNCDTLRWTLVCYVRLSTALAQFRSPSLRGIDIVVWRRAGQGARSSWFVAGVLACGTSTEYKCMILRIFMALWRVWSVA